MTKLKNQDKKNIADVLALTPLQEGLLFHYLKDPGSDYYFEQLRIRISGLLDTDIFEKAWNTVVETNEMLRTVFRWEKLENPVQMVLKKHPVQWRYYDLSHQDNRETEKQLEKIIVNDWKEKFNLHEVPFRVTLCKIAEGAFEMIISNHHILYDGWSNGIILKEFFNAYQDIIQGKEPIKPVKTNFKEFIEYLRRRDKEQERQFWQEYLAGFEGRTEISPGRKGHETNDNSAVLYLVRLPAHITNSLEAVAKANRISTAAFLYTAWGLLLQRYCNSDDVVFGTTVSGRSAKVNAIEEIVGLFIATLPLRVQTYGSEKIGDLLFRINHKLQIREAYENTSPADIAKYSESGGRGELFDAIVVIENYPLDARLANGTGDLAIASYALKEAAHYGLTVVISLFAGIEITFHYCESIWEEEMIQRMAGHFLRILENMTASPNLETGHIEILSPGEKRQLLEEFNNTGADFPRDKTIPGLFAEQVERTPEGIALVGADPRVCPALFVGPVSLTYRQLAERSHRLAGLLIEKGALRGGFVGIMMERSIDLIIGILGILKAGCAYVPINPANPAERTNFILKDSGAMILINKSEIRNTKFETNPKNQHFGAVPVLDFEHSNFDIVSGFEFRASNFNSSNLAYLIYTSGSTGTPKGVPITYANISPLLHWGYKNLGIGPSDRAIQDLAYYFDWSVWEIFITLTSGAGLYIAPGEILMNPGMCIPFMIKNDITVLHVTPTRYWYFIHAGRELETLKYLFLGAETLTVKLLKRSFASVGENCRVFNMYGPTEATIISAVLEIKRDEEDKFIDLSSVPIGKPVANLGMLVLDRNSNLCPVNIPGELYIAGNGVAPGYLNNPELTVEKFKFNRSYKSYRTSIFYKTGDLARWLNDGNIEYLGRMDQQVKIRGFRIELGEIEERLLKHKRVKAAVVAVTESNISHLNAYIVLKNEELGTAEKAPDAVELREYLSDGLPDYMIPAHFFLLENIPLTPNGKVDSKALQASNTLLGSGVEYVSPKSDIERVIVEVWKDLLGLDKVGVHDNFFDLGGNSLSIIRLNSRLKEALPDKKEISVVTLFNYPTVAALARYLNREEQDAVSAVAVGKVKPRFERSKIEIAVIGMAGRFPGAKNIAEFWDNIKNGVESIRFFTQEQLKQLGVEDELINNPDYVPAKGVLENKEYFDSFFFDYTPAEAEILDPQVRLFHECTWEALENAGYDPYRYDGAVGLYAGASPNPLWQVSPLTSGAVGGSYSEIWNALQFSDKDYLSTRIAYKLDLKGPCVTIQTACSTSLAAVEHACWALVNGTSAMALAGGVSVTFQDEGGYLYQEGTIMSPDGHCRAFDAGAKGTVGGNGVGVVVLKRLEEAEADGDTVYAVVKGFAVTNDGRNKVGFTAPSSGGQSKAIRSALELAGVNPESISYIEAHGTGTPLGDPIEMEGLKLAFNPAGTGKKHYCALGSIKTNIGHLDAAAGIAGFIKTVLSLYHRLIPPSLNFKAPNPQVDFENSPFYVNTQLKAWESNEYPLRAGVSSFGLGGTNVHVVLEEYAKQRPEKLLSEKENGVFNKLVLWSAKTPAALDRMSENLVSHFKQNPGLDLADAAYTLQVGRGAFTHRKMLVCSDTNEAIRKLQAGGAETAAAKEGKHTVIFMFSGQGSQYVNMGFDLYQNEPLFRGQLDECFQLLENITGSAVKPVLYPSEGKITFAEAEEKIFQFKYTTPIKFIFEYSLAKMLMKWGIRPAAMIGHSFGEYVAACLAGVFSLEDGLYLAALRGELMHGLPAGAMLSVPLSEKELQRRLTNEDELCTAGINAESLCVVSGPVEAVKRFEEELNREGHECLRFQVPKAGHSRMVEPIMAEFKQKIGKVNFAKPKIPFISCVSGTWITAEEAVDPGYWTRHLREPVRFADGLTTLFKEPNPVFLQTSPGKGLILFINQHPDNKEDTPALSMVRHHKEPVADVYHIMMQIGRLWLNGIENHIAWPAFYEKEGAKRRRIPLPSYPFEAIHYPVNRDLFKPGAPPIPFSKESGSHETRKKMDTADAGRAAGPREEKPVSNLRGRRPQLTTLYIPPRSSRENEVAGIWEKLLGYEQIGIRDNFFELNGDSLKAVIAISKIHKQTGVKVPLKDFFTIPTVEGLVQYIDEAQDVIYHAIEPVEKKEYYPLSSAQERMFILNLYEEERGGTAYSNLMLIELAGEFNNEKFQVVILELIRRHESLRTSFFMINDKPVQRIEEKVEFQIDKSFTDIFQIKKFIRPFDLSSAPLLRVGLLKIAEKRHILMLDMHHIITDGTSFNVFAKEFMTLYSGMKLPALKIQYKDFVLWQNSFEETGKIAKQEIYWLGQFAGEVPILNLMIDFPRPAVQSFAGSTLKFEVDQVNTAALRALALKEGSTLYMLFLAVLNILLSKLGGQEDIIVGMPTAGRRHADLQQVIGMFVNTLALRNFPAAHKTFRKFLGEVKQKTLAAFENQEYPFENLVEKVVVNRDTGRNPLFDVIFVLQNIEKVEIAIPGLLLKPYEYQNAISKFDLTFFAVEEGNKVVFTVEYCTALFKEETIKHLITYFNKLLLSIIAEPGQKIWAINILPEEERKRLLYDFNDTGSAYPAHKTLQELFTEQVEKVPDSIALIGAALRDQRGCTNCLTYSELNKQSNRLAGLLIKKGVWPESIVGIMIERSIEMMIGIFGILKAGCAYLPIDPDYPKERIDYMLKDSGTKILLTANKIASLFTEGIFNFHHSSFIIHHSSHLAYIIYTSGSTGKPKGVMVEHRNVTRVVRNTNYIELNTVDRILQLSNYAFDGSIFDIFGALLNGSSLVMIRQEDVLEVNRLSEIIENQGITVFFITTALFNTLVDLKIECFRYIRKVLFGGERISVEHSRKALDYLGKRRIIHVYGPTETTVYASYYFIDAITGVSITIPIGKPIANTTIYILDKNRKPVPVGIPGEIYIGGAGIARGYLNNPELTAEKIGRDDICDRFYKTGDLARWLADGNIEFSGRLDHQVKIRGFRIELGEIESRLLKYPGIKEAIVLVTEEEHEGKYICAYLVCDREYEISELSEFLAKELPDYMIPSYFVPLEKIPLTANGKIDLSLLPKPDLKTGQDYVAPRNEMEERLIALWGEVLNIKPGLISIDSSFFHLGGHSLKAAVLASRVHKEFNVLLPLTELFKTPTIRGLSGYIRGKAEDVYESIMPVEEKEYYSLSSAQKRLFVLQQMDSNSVSYNIPEAFILEGEPDPQRLTDTTRKMIQRHESFRTSFIMVNNEPVQRIHEKVEFEVEFEIDKSFAGCPGENFIRFFDLSCAPLMRVGLQKIEEARHILMLDMHHIIADGTSLIVFAKEFMALYSGTELPVLKIHYKDFAMWHKDFLETGKMANREKYWLSQFEGEIPALNLLTDFIRPSVQSFEGSTLKFEVGEANTAALKTLAIKEQVTLYMLFLAVFNISFSKLAGQEDIIMGMPTAGRLHADLQQMIGMFVNTLALRNFPVANKTFRKFLKEVKQKTLAAFDNQEYSFEDLVEKVVVNRDTSRNPLFDVLFVLQNIEKVTIEIPGLLLKSYEFQSKISKFDLTLVAVENGKDVVFSIEYCTALYKEETVKRLIRYFNKLISSLLEDPGQKIFEMEILPEEERKQILYDFNDKAAPFPVEKTINQLVEEQVEKFPDCMALVFSHGRTRTDTDNICITYRELDKKSNYLAGLLIEKGVVPGNIVGIKIERSLEMIIGILGILKLGGAYLPLAPDYPQERIDYMLKDSGAKIVVNSELIKNVSFHHSSFIIHHSNFENDLAYIIYTSGTTGRPKGVMVEHRNVIRLVKNTDYVEFKKNDRILQTGALEFDASTFEIWGALLNGLMLFLVKKEQVLSPAELRKNIEKYDISLMWLTSSLFNRLVDADIEIFAPLRNLLVGGEALSPVHINKVRARFAQLNIINGYGPTENTTFSTTYRVNKEYKDHIPIGRPIANSTAYIIDRWNRLQPIGAAGELYVGGHGVARGYLNNPELTAERFKRMIHDRLYRTGDLARWLPDGNIEFSGRIDHQVKIRGFRIEPGEIENRLLNYPGIKEAVVLLHEEKHDEKYICAYLVSDGNGITGLHEKLAKELPDYMIPSYFISLARIPLTANGKIDRHALPKPELKASQDYVAPRNELEERLVALWGEVLNIKPGLISIDSSFFHLGGHSLKAAVLASRVHKEFNVLLPLAELFKTPTIRGLSGYVMGKAADVYESIMPVEEKEYYSLSSAQKRLFVLQQMDSNSVSYNIPEAFILEGEPDPQRLTDTTRKMIQRHESFRTSFIMVNNEPVQRIHEKVEFEVEFEIDKSGAELFQKRLPEEPPEIIIKKFIRPFDLSYAPLLRVGLLKIAEKRHILMLDMHHIITDGTSFSVFAKEFMTLYSGTKLPAIKIQYKDFVPWQNRFEETGKMAKQENYWLDQFAGEIPVLNLMTDFTRPAVQSFAGSTLKFEVGNGCKAALNALARKEGITLYMLILAVFNVLFSRLGRQEDIIVGMPTAGRRHADLQQVIGMFVNTLALRNFPRANKTFRDFLVEVKQTTLNAFENQEYPFENLVEKVLDNRDQGRNPLFDVMFVLQNLENVEIEIPGLLLKPYEFQNKISKFDLTLIAVENGSNIVFTIEYCTALFKEETIKRFIRYFKKLLLSVLGKPGRKIVDIEIIPGEERRRLLYDFNKTESEYPGNKTIHGLFEEQAEKVPHSLALVGSVCLSYRELNEQSDRLAGLLVEKGVLAESIVGIMVERSPEMVTGILGILKAGGVYLPIDPAYPPERIDYMLNDSRARILINKSEIRNPKFETNSNEKNSNGQNKNFEISFVLNFKNLNFDIVSNFEFRASDLISSNIAYIIYTSGSTGRPKGVLVRHEGFINLIYYHRQIFGEAPGIKISQVANPGFDAMAFEVWPCLASGAALYIVGEETRLDPIKMKQWLIEKEIDISFQPTVMAEQLLDEVWPEEGVALKILRTAGDKLTCYPDRKYPFKLYNLYGPTEDTVWTTWSEVPVKPELGGLPPIGKPIANHRVYITGPHLEILPLNVPGELCIGGVGLAAGYLNRPELTAEKFINFHHSSFIIHHSNLYRTGDLARWLIGGNIEFLGRIDGQVKLRGFRIELGEIENRLVSHDDIKEATVVLKEKNGQPYLCAYFVAVREIIVSELREFLAGMLPAYMIPSYFVPLDRIPLTPNGKVDRGALPEPLIKTGENYGAPVNFIEEKLVEIWQEVLGSDGIGIHDNFFEMGGDSIKGVQIVSRLQKHGLKMEVAALFAHPTIRGVAASIKKIERIANQGAVTGWVELTPIQRWFFQEDFTCPHHFNQAVMVYREAGFDEAIIRHVFQKIVVHHDALRMVYEKENLKVVQRNRGIEGKLFDLEVFDFQNEPDVKNKIERSAERIQTGIILETGPLVRLGLFKTSNGDHLLMVVHHLVIDGVSWRILLEDLSTGYRQALKGEPVKFQVKTDSFKEWAWRLTGYAGSEILLKESAYWKRIEIGNLLPKDMEINEAEKKVKNFETIELKLNEAETGNLMRRVHRAYRTEIDDILLAGFVAALREWWGIEKVLVNLEGHGREDLTGNVVINRTVGWFTSQYPVLLKVSRPGDTDYLIKEVKETLRRVPRRGIGYGILKYAAAVDKKETFPANLEAEINFNYLGEFGPGLHNDIFQVSELGTGHSQSPEMEKEIVLDINGLIVEGRLTLFISYNRKQYKRETMAGLSEVFRSNLTAIIEHCVAREVKTLTPSDLTYSEFTIDELDVLVGRWSELEDIYELAPMQAGMLFHALKEKTSGAYFQQTVFSLHGEIDDDLMQIAFRQLIDRYDVFRTVFYYENVYQPVQIVLKKSQPDIDFHDLQATGAEEMERVLQDFYRQDRQKGFDLAGGPLTRLVLLKTGCDSYRLIWSFHHILMDGWCLGIVFKELLHIYRCLRKGVPVALAPVSQYRHYIQWLRVQATGVGARYWQNYLEGYEQQVGLPRRREMRPGEAYRLEEYSVYLEDIFWERLKTLSADCQVTVNTVMQVVWGILLQRYNNTEDVVFGAVTSGRPPGIEGIEGMVGLFINTLPVRVKTVNKKSFARLLREVQVDSVSSRSYEYLSLADIQAGSLLKDALIDHIMVFENYPLDQEIKNNLNPGEHGFTVSELWAFEQTNYDFNIGIAPLDSLAIKFSYNALVFAREWVERTWGYLNNILIQIVEKTGLEVGEIAIMTDEEMRRILYDFNETAAAYPDDKTIHQLFAEQAARMPDRIALVGADLHGLSYRELNGQAGRLAGGLVEKGVPADSIVGIMVERSVEMIIGILGILKSGGAYLPIDPDYPQERIDYMLKDSAAKILLTATKCVFNFHHSSFTIHHSSYSSHLAYLIYTSGSTGRPKGVAVTHRNVVAYLAAFEKEFQLTETDAVVQQASYTFDAFVEEMYPVLLKGGKLAVPSRETVKNIFLLVEFIARHNITVITCSPLMLDQLNSLGSHESLRSIHTFISGGDVLKGRFIDKLLKIGKVYNTYGPTESTVCVTYYRCRPDTDSDVPIGKPIANYKAYVLDRNLCPVPPGIPGELCVAGPGLARGYLNNPELTTEKFIKSFWKSRNLFSKRFLAAGGIFYSTGDLARWLDDGNIEFLGRMDHQVKIRGFRIETGEIETVLLKHDAVRSAVVLAKEEGYLCAYFTSEREIPVSLLREYTAMVLPDYMIPSYFIRLEEFPLTSSGKIDRKALPEPGIIKGREYKAPTGKVEEKLAEIWAEVLGISRETIGAETNFFHLGGHSLRATVLMSKIHKYLNIKIPLEEIFKTPTIRGLAVYMKSAEEDKFSPIPPAEEKEYYVLSASQYRFYMFQQLEREATIYNTPEVVLLQGKLDRKKLEEIFQKLIARHESFRTSFIIVGGEVVQQIRRDVDFEIEYMEDGKKKRRLEGFIRPFDLSRAPLLRVGLIKEKEEEHILVMDTHHIISDGASQTLFIKEFMDLYRDAESLPARGLRTRYKDYAEWQNTADMRKVLEIQEAYWLKEFAGDMPVSNLPIDFERPGVMHFEGSMMEFQIETGETGALKRLASEEGVSLFGLVLTIVNVFLAKMTRQEDICIGTQVAGRRHPDSQGIIGVFLNSLALRNFPGQEKTFKTFLHQVMERTLQAFENQEYQFESLVEKVLGKREVNRNPLFDVMLVWQNFERQEIQVPGLTLKPYPHEHKSRALTDLGLYGWEKDSKLLFTFEYSTELFEKETVERFITYFKEIVVSVIVNQEIKLKDIKVSHDLGMAEPGLFRDGDDDFGF